ncbi:MAG: sugar ABC transporter permease, partial [Oscillospiraceae bacterium]|nr:sugar ABC transporter permease [Oscillospiraceae bacterium]
MKKRTKVMRSIGAWSWLMPSLLGVLVFFLIPFGVVVYYSVLDNPIFANFVGVDNFMNLFRNTAFLRASRNTGIFS